MSDKKSSRTARFLQWYTGENQEQPPQLDNDKPPLIDRLMDVGIQTADRFRLWKNTSFSKAFPKVYVTGAVVVCMVFIVVLLITVSYLPPFGNPDNPAQNVLPNKYISDGVQDTGAVNVVASMILDYRAFDTLGESTVLFVAATAVIILLRHEGEHDTFDDLLHEMEEPRHDIILQKIAMVLVPIILIFGLYVVFNGHLGPGGGFSGGAIMGAGIILYASAFGTKRARKIFSYRNCRMVIFFSLMFYALSKCYVFFMGANHLVTGIPLGIPGTILSAGLILPLNICVGFIVASTMYIFYVLFSKGEMR